MFNFFKKKNVEEEIEQVVEEKEDFSSLETSNTGKFKVIDVYNMPGRGVLANGTVIEGKFSVNDEVTIKNLGEFEKVAKIKSIEVFMKKMETCKVGDTVGLILEGIELEDVATDDIISR